MATDKKKVVIEQDDDNLEEVKANSNKVDFTKVYHVSKRASDNKRTIKFAYGSKVIKLCDTKVEAVAYAKALAEKQDGVVLVHASKGKNKGRIQKQ